ncbi:hypothetical protein MAR_005787 [Mya arenaria]|uniref:Uncharacterized protein n=1 Tax=Mya arenaria TaxID=6604 RepID=A0ABY7F0H2_MYAAR|nr:hypothetical protein MAR_005787 [Mya arenaria]
MSLFWSEHLERWCLLFRTGPSQREGYSERESHLERVLPVERCGVLYLGLILCSAKREGYSERESHLERVLPVERCGVLYLGLILCSAKREGYSERESHLERVLPVERCGVLYLGLILCSAKPGGCCQISESSARADMRPAPFGTSVEIPRQSQNMAKKDLLLHHGEKARITIQVQTPEKCLPLPHHREIKCISLCI